MSTERLTKILAMLEQMPNDPFLRYGAALEYVSSGDDSQAEQYFQWILANHADYLPMYYQLGKLLERKPNNEDAIRIYSLGIELAASQKDQHTRNELQNALDELY